MAHSSERTSSCSNIQNVNISANIDSHMAILSSSVAPNLSERKPSKVSFSNVDRRVSALLLDRDQRTCEKEHGVWTVVQTELHTIACKKP
jgi:hypothetical protein